MKKNPTAATFPVRAFVVKLKGFNHLGFYSAATAKQASFAAWSAARSAGFRVSWKDVEVVRRAPVLDSLVEKLEGTRGNSEVRGLCLGQIEKGANRGSLDVLLLPPLGREAIELASELCRQYRSLAEKTGIIPVPTAEEALSAGFEVTCAPEEVERSRAAVVENAEAFFENLDQIADGEPVVAKPVAFGSGFLRSGNIMPVKSNDPMTQEQVLAEYFGADSVPPIVDGTFGPTIEYPNAETAKKAASKFASWASSHKAIALAWTETRSGIRGYLLKAPGFCLCFAERAPVSEAVPDAYSTQTSAEPPQNTSFSLPPPVGAFAADAADREYWENEDPTLADTFNPAGCSWALLAGLALFAVLVFAVGKGCAS